MKKINRIHPIIFFILALSTSLFAQKGSIKGIISDGTTNEALIGANVYIKGTSIGSSTDLDGFYTINSITPGTHILVASYLGYQDAEKEITIEAGKVLEINMSQTYLAVEGVEVIVTAQAEAQMAAINRQLSAKTIKNVVSAKKIQENPDANAAEAIGRLPGVSIQRNGGEGSKVVVRGLSPKFNKVTIEGVSMASTGSDDRSSDLSMISPYMLEGIELSKAALPNQEADVIGGSVNFVLREAPEKKSLDVLAQTGYGGLKNRLGDYKFVVGGSSRFLDNKFGIFAQVDVEQRYRDAYDLNISYIHTTSPDTQEAVDVSVGQLFKSDTERKVQRLGGVVVLDYKLPSGKIKLSSFASKINRNVLRRSEVLRPLFVDHFYRLDDTESNLLVMNNSLRFENTFGGLKIDGGISYVFSNNDSPKGISFQATELSAFDLVNEAGENFDITKSPAVVASFAKNNINDAEVSLISKNTYTTNEKGASADLNFTYDLNLSDQVSIQLKAGGKLKKLTKAYDLESDRIQVTWGAQGAAIRELIVDAFPEMREFVSENVSKLPYHLFIDKEYEPNDFLGEEFTLQNIPDIGIANKITELAEGNYFKHYPGSKMSDYKGEENYAAAYLMAEFKIGKAISFTPGFRFENNKTEYTGSRGSSQSRQWFDGYIQHDTTTFRDNSFFLPMVHLKYKPIDWFDLRLAYTQTLARPSFNEIIPFWDRQQKQVLWNNPFLEPAKSTNLDAYASFYQSKLGLFTIGVFSKDIDDLIFSPGSSAILDPAVFGLPENSKGKTIFQKINNERSTQLRGIEIEWQTRFWYMDNFLKNFIFNINYTHTISKVEYPRTIVTTTYLNEAPWVLTENTDTFYEDRLVSQPDNILNATLGFDYKGLSTRISLIFQDNIFAEPNFWNKHRTISDQSIRFDFSLKQNLPFKGWEAFFNFNNITSELDRTINISTKFPRKEQHYGYKIDLGVRYRIK